MRRVLGDEADQLGAAARHDEVDDVAHLQQLADSARSVFSMSCTASSGTPADAIASRRTAASTRVRVDRLVAAAEDAGVAGLEAERRDVDGDVGPALEDRSEHAEGHARAG